MPYPITESEVREHWLVEREECPDCGDELDTGWECSGCQRDFAAFFNWRIVIPVATELEGGK